MEGIDYIQIIGAITSGYARFESEDDTQGQLSFEQPYLVGDTWNVNIQGVNVNGGSIPAQTIEIEVPEDEVPEEGSGYFYWGNVMRYVAKKAKKILCPDCI